MTQTVKLDCVYGLLTFNAHNSDHIAPNVVLSIAASVHDVKYLVMQSVKRWKEFTHKVRMEQ
jgi:hypothetical protein